MIAWPKLQLTAVSLDVGDCVMNVLNKSESIYALDAIRSWQALASTDQIKTMLPQWLPADTVARLEGESVDIQSGKVIS